MTQNTSIVEILLSNDCNLIYLSVYYVLLRTSSLILLNVI